MENLIERLAVYTTGKTDNINELAGEHMLSPVPPYALTARQVMGTSCDI